MKKVLLFGLVVTSLFCTANILTAQTITTDQTGTHNGFYYSFWNQGGGGSVSMTLGAGGNYSATWSNCTNFTCGKGWNPGSADKVINFSGSFNGGNNGYLAIYGWTKNPLIEYYVVESYGAWTPPGGTSLGTMTSDGGTYNIYKMHRDNAPSIIGPASFDQFWSVRTSKRSSGTVTLANHINAWRNKGMNMGTTWDYLIVETEGYQSSGSSNITVSSNNVTPTPTTVITPTPTAVISPTPTPTPTTPVTATPTGVSGGCTSPISITVPFTKDGAGEFCWSTATIGNYINSWNLTLLEINGVNLTNKWVAGSSLPAKQNGLYYIHYKGEFSWCHFEAK